MAQRISVTMAIACCMSVTNKNYNGDAWAKQLVKDVTTDYKVVLFVDSNNSTCDRLKKIFEEDIKVDIHTVEIDKMDYKPIERELERVTGCRIVKCCLNCYRYTCSVATYVIGTRIASSHALTSLKLRS